MPTYPHGSRFHPTELGLVKLHLKNKVDDNNSGFIKTLNVYGDAPWLLDHDTNPLYCRNEWYYFVPRKIRGVKTVSRMIPSNGDSFLGGTWKSIGKRKEIKNSAKELKGYKRELVFNKNVVGKSEKEKTDWHMDEYSLHKNGDEFHDLVLCHIRLLNSAERFQPHVPAAHQADHENNDNNILQNQDQQEAGDANQQQQEQEDSHILPHPPPLEINNNLDPSQFADMTELMPNFEEGNDKQEYYPPGDIAFDGVDDGLTFDIDELWESLNEGKEQEYTPFVPSQVENHNKTVVPNQEQADFAIHYDMWMMVEKEHDDDDFKQDPQYQEQLHKYLQSFHLDPSLDDFGFDGAEDDWLEQLHELEKERLSKPVPRAQDSGVHEDQVTPKD